MGDKLPLRIGDIEVRRDFIAIGDTVSAYCTILEKGVPGAVYNVCSGVAHSIEQLARRACSLFGLEAEFDVQTELVRKGERRRLVVLGDAARLRSLGWESRVNFEQLIRELVESYRAQPASEK